MLQIIGLIVVLLAIGAAVYYFGFYKKGKINDRDGDPKNHISKFICNLNTKL